MGSKGGGQVIGYKYYLGMDFSWCHAPVDRITAFYLDNRPIYQGCFQEGTIEIDKPNLFGEVEGGISGFVDLENGGETQTPNTYTTNAIEGDVPAYRGVTRTVFRGSSSTGGSRSCYVGNNPYLKRITGEMQRIYKRIRDGEVVDQWLPAIAGIPLIEPNTTGLEFATGEVQNQSLFINVDLSSASNGYSGRYVNEVGNGLVLQDVKQAIINSLLDIRNVLQWANDGTEDFLGNNQGDSGLDIGIGYVRHTTGAQNNTSNNPNNLDPYEAPGWDAYAVPDQTSQWNLPRRGWQMKQNATKEDIDDLISFVEDFVVVPDLDYTNIDASRELFESMYNNALEAFNSLGTARLRGHIAYSGFVTDESVGTIIGFTNDLDDLLAVNAGTDSPVKGVYGPGVGDLNGTYIEDGDSPIGDAGTGSKYMAYTMGLPIGQPKDGYWTVGGGWYIIAQQDPVDDDGPTYMDFGSGAPYEVGDLDLVSLPSGSATDFLFGLPPDDSKTWYWGGRINSGIYEGRFDVTEHWQRDTTGPTTVLLTRDGEQYDWNPYHDVKKFTIDTTQQEGVDDESASLWLKNICGGYLEMNPAHIIRECLTDQQWGLGLAESEIDETSFAAAAQTLYDELFGLSMAWQSETPIEDFINVVLNHIDAVLYVDRSDGLWHLVLIRDDYDPETIPSYTDADVVSWSNVNIKSPAELTNSVTVKYNSRELRGEASVTVNNVAQRQKLGKPIHTTVNYPGIWQDKLATRVGQRDLITLSTSLIGGEIELTRKAYDLAPGDVFKLTSSRYNLNGEIMRVAEVNVGDGRQNSVRVTFTQDKFNFDFSESTDLVDPPDTEFTDPGGGEAGIIEYSLVTEEPYYSLVLRQGEIAANEIETTEQDIGFIFASAIRPTSSSVFASTYYDDGSGYRFGSQVNYGPSAILDAEMREEADDTTLTVRNFNFYRDVSVNDLIQINDEVMRIDSIDSTTQMTVARGALDTVPAYHQSDARVFFVSISNGVTGNEFVAGDSIDVKLLDNTNGSQGSPADAEVKTVTMASRITGPYPVGQFQLDSAYSGVWDISTGNTISATWVDRDRTQQNTSTPPAHTDADVGPETGVNYTISAVAYDMFGQEITSIGDLFSVDKNQTTSHTITPSDNTPASEGTDEWSAVGVRVKTDRGGYDNWQTPEVMAYTQCEPEWLVVYNAAWMDANVLGSMYQDMERNTSVSDGDPVAFMENQKDDFL